MFPEEVNSTLLNLLTAKNTIPIKSTGSIDDVIVLLRHPYKDNKVLGIGVSTMCDTVRMHVKHLYDCGNPTIDFVTIFSEKATYLSMAYGSVGVAHVSSLK